MMPLRIACLAAVALAVPFAAFAEDQSVSYQNLLTPIFAGNQTVIGQTIAYPAGIPKVTAAIVTMPPGGETGWHIHAVPLFAYILEGALTVDYGEKGIKVYEAGGGGLEATNWPHNGSNKGEVPLRLLVVYMGAEDEANATPVAGPAD